MGGTNGKFGHYHCCALTYHIFVMSRNSFITKYVICGIIYV